MKLEVANSAFKSCGFFSKAKSNLTKTMKKVANFVIKHPVLVSSMVFCGLIGSASAIKYASLDDIPSEYLVHVFSSPPQEISFPQRDILYSCIDSAYSCKALIEKNVTQIPGLFNDFCATSMLHENFLEKITNISYTVINFFDWPLLVRFPIKAYLYECLMECSS